MRFIVTGATGYIGSKLVKALLQRGDHVVVLSRQPKPEWMCWEGDLRWVEWDITTNPGGLQVEGDVLIHLAAANDVASQNPTAAISGTVIGTRHALELCVQNGINNFIYFSTLQVYGAISGKISENTLTHPLSDYGFTHWVAEEYVRMFNRISGLGYVILRPSNVFGAPLSSRIDRWSLVPSCLCLDAHRNGSVTLKSSGLQERDFISLDDVVSATLYICDRLDDFLGSVLNVASGRSQTIRDVARMVCDIYAERQRKECVLNCLTEEPDESQPLTVQSDRLKSFGWSSSGSESMGIEIGKIFDLLQEKM